MESEYYLKKANVLLSYFQRNYDDSGGDWKFGVEKTKEWLDLLNKNDVKTKEAEDFFSTLSESATKRTCSLDELLYFVKSWQKEISI